MRTDISGSISTTVNHTGLENFSRFIKIKLNRARSNILFGKSRGGDTAARERITECLGHVALAVIHAFRIDITAVEADFTLRDCDIDPTQIRTILIRPEHCLRTCVADAVRAVVVLRTAVDVVNDTARIHTRTKADIRLCPCGGRIRRRAVHNLHIVAVVRRRDILAIITLDRVARIVLGCSVRLEVAVVVCRRRCPAHKCRQHRRGTSLVDTPLRTGRTRVVDGTAPC